ncbi:HK97 family phage prohead protease [Roseinatronobacter sp.]|uniref:HK97 family phage prohead protease n=1 Tax=Roseinatronobacter sp. TaxID=1945755 RepID=UPI003F72A273
MEYKFCKPDTGLTLSDGHAIAGYASVFGQRDKGGDTVQRGAYAASLQRLAARGDHVRMLWQHDPAQPIGIWDQVIEDAHGLFVKGRLLPDVARAREALALVQAGALDGLSIGYRTVRAQALATGGRNLIELDLWEVSLVTFPMLAQARISVKSDLLAGLATATASLRDARAAVARL